MSKKNKITGALIFGLLLPFLMVSQSAAHFIPNQGQWSGSFHTKLSLNHGAIFFTPFGYRLSYLNIGQHDHGAEAHSHKNELPLAASFEMRFQNANTQVEIGRSAPTGYPRNYFLGNNSKHWISGLKASNKITQYNIYRGIHLEYLQAEGGLKYNFIIEPGASPSKIVQQYTGLESLTLQNGILNLEMPLGSFNESIPEAYQIIDGVKVFVSCSYQLNNNQVSYKLGRYNPNYELIIDPVLLFSTFSGSGDLNYGNTATPAANGGTYAAGTNFGPNYPTTLGAVQKNFATDSVYSCDAAISKFSSNGQNLLYATYLGGEGIEVPQSLIADGEDNLYILGTTGAKNFPVTENTFQEEFGGGSLIISRALNDFYSGSDLFITKISSSGDMLLGSTYWGGSGNEGYNSLEINYGDHFRSEIQLSANGRLAIVSSTNSTNLPNGNLPNGAKLENSQDAVIGLFSNDLKTNLWASYFGGDSTDAGYAISVNDSFAFITGGTKSHSLPKTQNAVQPTNAGGLDGFIAKFHLTTGINQKSSFIGSPDYDQSYLLQQNKQGSIFLFGQTEGDWTQSPNTYFVQHGTQFLAKLNAGLDQIEWQTTLGSGLTKQDLVPSAFMVDNCQNIYLAGWNGTSNAVGTPPTQNGNTHSLPISGDAYQSTTDGNDFYFMVLSRDANSLLYGSFFGGNDNEHVDGGTSRFDPNGIVHQAVCSNCMGLGFPTTPNAYSPNAGAPTCNMAVFKFSFDQTLEANANVSFTTDVDSVCDGLIVNFSNNSQNATNYKWYFGNGDSATSKEPVVTYFELGTYEVTFIAIDSLCEVADTLTLSIDHSQAVFPVALATVNYQSCDNEFNAAFNATESYKAHRFTWLMPDGTKVKQPIFNYQFNQGGTQEIILIVEDTVCQRSDTITKTIRFADTLLAPFAHLSYSDCSNGSIDVAINNHQTWYQYIWNVEGGIYRGKEPPIRFNYPGIKLISLLVKDTVCNKEFFNQYRLELGSIKRASYVPTAFSPNGDGLNEKFEISGDNCAEGQELIIFNRWGEQVFRTQKPFSVFWDGTIQQTSATSGVYTYSLREGDVITQGSFMLIR